MDINTAFPTKYLSAADLGQAEPTVTIDRVQMEQMQDGSSAPVLYFQGKNKGLVLNKTNGRAIGDLYGGETTVWTGRQVTLFVIWTEYAGQPKQGIRVRGPGAVPAGHVAIEGAPPPVPQPQHVDPTPPIPSSAPPTPEQVQGLTNEVLSDEIPF